MSKCTNRMTTFKNSTQEKSLVKISSLSASGTAESSRSPTKASTWNRSPFDKSCRIHIRKMEMESFKSAMNQAQTNWKCKPKLSMYKYMYMKSFKPAKKKKDYVCKASRKWHTSKSQPPFTCDCGVSSSGSRTLSVGGAPQAREVCVVPQEQCGVVTLCDLPGPQSRSTTV